MDISPLLPFLSSLGPWGVVIGFAIPLILGMLGVKNPLVKTPDPAPLLPGPPLLPSVPSLDRFPILNALLKVILPKGGLVADNVSREWLSAVHKEIGDLLDAKK